MQHLSFTFNKKYIYSHLKKTKTHNEIDKTWNIKYKIKTNLNIYKTIIDTNITLTQRPFLGSYFSSSVSLMSLIDMHKKPVFLTACSTSECTASLNLI